MFKKITFFICFLLLLGAVNSTKAEPFSLIPTFDGHVSNDTDEGPDTSPGGSGMHCRNQGGRRRVGFVTYDLAEVQALGANFSNISFSNYGHDTGQINVYGVLEEYEDLVGEGMTWNTAPGVQNDPTPAVDSDVALDLADVTEILLTFNAPARGTRESTDTSEALADFLNSDTNGFVAFMFAPEGSGGAIVRTVEMGEEGGTWLEGDISGSRDTAYNPAPADGAMYPDTWVNLSWTAGAYAVSHDVYIGENYDDVNEATRESDLFRINHELAFYITGFAGYAYENGLVPGTTYYWRIDEVNEADPNSPWKGDVWSFTVPPKTAYFPEPADGAELVILNVQLRWTAGLGAKLHYVVFGEDFDEVNNAAAGIPNGNPNYNPGPLKLAKTYYWRIDESDGFDTYKGEVWSFTTEGAVSGPNPADEAEGVKPSVILSWNAGAVAESHEVYFGTDADAVENATKSSPEYKGPKALGEESYDPGNLALTTTYYWRIDEVNSINSDSPWAGNVWSFTTGDFFVIDDFEDYDAGENQIWYAWHDGLGYGTPGSADYYAGNGTGAAVGDETTDSYTEETVIHGGGQSMPLVFDNNKQDYAYYSEVEQTLTDQRDWTEEGVAELSLWFRGNPASVGSFVEGPTGTYTMTASGTDIWNDADEFHYAFKTLTGAGSIQAQVLSVDNTDTWAKAGVMFRETLEPGSKFAAVYITPTNADGTATNGCRFQVRTDTDGAATSDTSVATDEQTAITAPYWVKLERDFAGNFRAYYSSDGTTWQLMSWGAQNISMDSDVYVGLAVTSHNTDATCEGRFSNVTITGTVGPQWANQDIGILSNDPEPMYLAVSNSTGEPVVVVHDDPAATQIETWTEWVISLQDLADQGLNLNDVDSIAIGVGTRGNTTAPGGSGKMFIDDIRLYGPRDIVVEE
jgi:hypothetical protein